MKNILGFVLCGMMSVMVVSGLIDKVKQADKEITLPAKIEAKEYLMIFLCGVAGYQGIDIITVITLGLEIYVAFMAYIDYHTKKVYSALSYMLFLVGVFWLFTTADNWKTELIYMLIFLIVVIVGYAIKAYALGDAEMFMALYPYFIKIIFDGQETLECLFRIAIWLSVTLLLTVIMSIKIHPLRLEKKKAMAPAIAITFTIALCSCWFL